MLFAVRFTDKPGSLPIRQQFLGAHLEWLERHPSILVAGSLRPEPEAAPVGALWIVEAESKEEIEALFQSDPFWTAGLRQGCEILHWFKAVPERKVPI